MVELISKSMCKMKKIIKEVYYPIGMVSIALVAAFFRLFKLTELPFGIHIDEAGLGVNAYALANFGVDRYLNPYPIYPENFYGGQSPFYTYLVAFFIKFFRNGELDLLGVRLPMVLLSLAAFFAGLFLLKKLVSPKWQLLGGFIYAVLPYFIMQCRFGLDCNALVSMLTLSLAVLYLALEKDNYWLYALWGLMWGLTYYTYALSYIANTITLLFLSIYLLYTRRTDIKKLIIVWGIAFVVAVPLVVMLAVNAFNLPDLMIGKMSIFKMDSYRGTQFGFSPKLLVSNFITVLKCILFNDGLDYSSFEGFYTMYICSVPFLFIGLLYLTVITCKSIKNRAFAKECIFYLVFLAQYFSGMFLGEEAVPQIHRLNGIFFAQFIVVLYGIYALVQGIKVLVKTKKNFWENGVIGVIGVTYLVSFLLFARFYFYEYKDAIYPQMLYSDQYEYTLQALEEMGLDDVDTYISASIVYFQFSTQMNPYDLYNTPGANLGCYKNYYFIVPGIEKGNVYVLRKEDSYLINEAINQGLELLWEDGMWRVYY